MPSAPVAGMPTPNQSQYAFSDAALNQAVEAISGGELLNSEDVGRLLTDNTLDPQTHAWHKDGFPISHARFRELYKRAPSGIVLNVQQPTAAELRGLLSRPSSQA